MSSKGGSQRASHTEGAHPTASGRLREVALLKQSYPALAVNATFSLGCQVGDLSQPPLPSVVALLPCRGYSLTAWVHLTGGHKLIRDKSRVQLEAGTNTL